MVFQRSMLNWRRRLGQSAMVICALFYIDMKHWCNSFPYIYAQLEEGGMGQSVMVICALFYIDMKHLV